MELIVNLLQFVMFLLFLLWVSKLEKRVEKLEDESLRNHLSRKILEAQVFGDDDGDIVRNEVVSMPAGSRPGIDFSRFTIGFADASFNMESNVVFESGAEARILYMRRSFSSQNPYWVYTMALVTNDKDKFLPDTDTQIGKYAYQYREGGKP